MHVIPYIIFNGNCEEALNFYAQALNGEVQDLSRFGDAPSEGMEGVDKNQVMHAKLVAQKVIIMASDSGKGTEAPASGMVNLSLDFDNPEDQKKVFDALSQGGKVTMPLQDTFWGATFGMLTDKYGVKWMFNHDK